MESKNNVRISNAVAYIKLSFSDISISIKDIFGNLLSHSSASLLGFSGSSKNSIVSAKKVASTVAYSAKKQGIEKVSIIIKGSGVGRQATISSIEDAGLEIDIIKDISPLHHNGCKTPKIKRRYPVSCNFS